MHSTPSWQAARGHDDRAPTERPPAPPPLVSAGLLAGLLPAASEPRLAELVESQLVRLNACEARLDLDLAAVLATFSIHDVHVLGHGDREAFSSERLGFSWSHARELLDIRKKLETLPLLRSAFLLGVLRRARLREIAKVATTETQAAWLAAARSLTSGELSARVKGARGKDAAKDLTEPPAATERVSIRVSPDEAVFIESVGLPMLRCVTGVQGPKHALIKHMTAEILTELGPADAHEHDHEGSCNPPITRAMRRKMRAEAKKDAKVHRAIEHLTAVADGEPDVAWPKAASDVLGDRLAHAQALVRWRRSIDWQRARLLALFQGRGWYGARGHASFGDWLDRRTGLAPREAAALMRTAEHVTDLGEIDEVWRSGVMTSYQADRVSRVASPETAEDWSRFVQEATGKRLDLELGAHAAMRVHLTDDGWRQLTGGRPMRERTMNDLRLQWIKIFEDGASGASGAEGAWTVPPSEGSCNPSPKTPPNTPPSAGPCRPPVPATFSFDAPPEVAADFRLALRRINDAAGGILDAAGCLLQMFTQFAATHVVPGIKNKTSRDGILRRDGFTCSMPHCRSTKNLEIHHVKYRSRGGRNERWNLILLCHQCHLLEHAGHVRIVREGIHQSRTGLAPALIVRVGRRDVTASQAIYQEGLLISRYETPEARPRRNAA